MNDVVIFDTALKIKQRERANIQSADYLFKEAADRLADRLEGVNRTFERTIEIDPRGDFLTHSLQQYSSVKTIERIFSENEFLDLEQQSYHLITSLLNLHWVNDVVGFLIQIQQALKSDGLFLGSLFGGLTLNELRQAQVAAESELYGGISPRISPFTDVREMAGVLQRAGFALPVADTETITVYYKDALTLMRDLKAMGEQNALIKRPKHFTSWRLLNKINQKYIEMFGTTEGIPATFEIITVTGWKEATSGERTP